MNCAMKSNISLNSASPSGFRQEGPPPRALDLSYGKAIDEVEHALRSQVEEELEANTNEDFERYREARESEIQNRLARFRYEREAQLREELEAASRQSARNGPSGSNSNSKAERPLRARPSCPKWTPASATSAWPGTRTSTWVKEETVLELELDMEERPTAFRERKMDEVATQLERQLDKREEIMRNKALIDVRRKEARIRAEIEAQLGLKRAEIRDRISGLSKKMDEFKTMAEERMRESITSQIEGEIATDEATLAEREAEMRPTAESRSAHRQASTVARVNFRTRCHGCGSGRCISARCTPRFTRGCCWPNAPRPHGSGRAGSATAHGSRGHARPNLVGACLGPFGASAGRQGRQAGQDARGGSSSARAITGHLG
ncbi:MAG: hypothetical protein CM15mP18_3360 [Methanobacteriota archaeon]|nr:MAG: hypothetical protein CM15mP18_3360 [Euryarchaeota archaeon]